MTCFCLSDPMTTVAGILGHDLESSLTEWIDKLKLKSMINVVMTGIWPGKLTNRMDR